MRNKRFLIIISAITIVLIILSIVCLPTNNVENHDWTEIGDTYIEDIYSNSQPIKEYDFMGGRCMIYPGEKDGYVVLTVFDIDMSDNIVASVSYGQQDISAEAYYKQYGADTKGGLVYSVDDRAYVDEWGQLYTTVSAPLYSQSVYSLSIDSRDACAWNMSEEQYRTLEEASSITFICADNRMSVALE